MIDIPKNGTYGQMDQIIKNLVQRQKSTLRFFNGLLGNAEQCQRRAEGGVPSQAGELGFEQVQDDQARIEPKHNMGTALTRFGVRDEQGRCRVGVIEASGQDQVSPRTGRNRTDQANARTGLLCPEKEWPEADQSQSQ